MRIHNLIEYNNNYSKTSGSLWKYYRDTTVANDAGIIVGFTNNGNSNSFNFKEKIIGQAASSGKTDVKIMLP